MILNRIRNQNAFRGKKYRLFSRIRAKTCNRPQETVNSGVAAEYPMSAADLEPIAFAISRRAIKPLTTSRPHVVRRANSSWILRRFENGKARQARAQAGHPRTEYDHIVFVVPWHWRRFYHDMEFSHGLLNQFRARPALNGGATA